MADKPKISQAEWQVMRVLWERSPLAVKEVIEKLSDKTSWKSETIRTLINRLARKKAIGFRKKGRRYYYFARLSEEECVKSEVDSFLSRAPAVMIKPILANFIENEHLSEQEIDELVRILEKKGGAK